MKPEKKQYYGGWGGYTVPFKPQEPLSEEEAKKREVYYIGYYDDKLLTVFEKYQNNVLLWKDQYEYWENTAVLKKRIMTQADGSEKPQDFDKKGNVIKE
jgi:hypothetical protein